MAMAYAETLNVSRPTMDRWVASDREEFSERFDGMELEKVREMLKTEQGKKDLLTLMKESDPSLSDDVDHLLGVVDRNAEQLEKKESFLMKMVKMPARAVMSVGKTIIKHPVLSAIGAAGVIALLFYFFGPAAGTVGTFGQGAIDTFNEVVLGNVPVATPEAGMGAAAETAVGGGLLGPNAAAEALESAQSAGTMMMENMEAAEAAGVSDGAMNAISEAADQVIANPNLDSINPVQEFFENMPQP